MKNIKIKACCYDAPLVDFNKKWANEEKCEWNEDACIICGKGIKEGSKREYLRMFDGGDYVTTDKAPDYELPNDMGWYPVGITCYNKYKKLEKEMEIEVEE